MKLKRVTIYGLAVAMAMILMNTGCQKVDALQTAPDFKLKNLDGQEVSLSQYRGRTVVLDFWATWCPPCRMSIPELVHLQKEYREKGLVVIGISLDDPSESSNLFLKAFKQKFSMNYTVLRYDAQVMKDYFGKESPAIPTMFLIDQEGRIRGKLVGYRPGTLQKAVKTLLK